MKQLIIPLVFLFAACSSTIPSDVIKPDKMQNIIFDLLRADEYVINYRLRDSTLDRKKESIRMYEQVFLIHQVTKNSFYKSYWYYQEHPDQNKALFDSLYNMAARKKELPSFMKTHADTSVKKK